MHVKLSAHVKLSFYYEKSKQQQSYGRQRYLKEEKLYGFQNARLHLNTNKRGERIHESIDYRGFRWGAKITQTGTATHKLHEDDCTR